MPRSTGAQVHHRQELLCQRQQRTGGHLVTAFGLGPGVLLVDGLSDAGNTTANQLLGDRNLLGLEGGQGGIAIGGGGSRSLPVLASAGPGRAVPPVTTRSGSGPGRAFGTGTATVVAFGASGSGCTVSGSPSVAASASTLAVGSVVPITAALGLAGQHHVDIGSRSGSADDIDGLDLPGRLALQGKERQYRRAVQGRLDLGPQHGALGGTVRDQGGVDGSPWLLGPGGAPGPRVLVCPAGEFDLDAMRHTGGHATAVADPHGHDRF
jgi:hypothetical protein